ncbi:3-hydroxyacyl-CoA dehydrogenase family protein [Mucilaginibacter sp. UR6-11]|uniref:3-hydroxyacyl-CoA dehydrogenase family protein n=1 Tax=Mucilaginibacter sp. UR6-11 TaxID=1435644 RepID=UPI001E313CB7|nr:3-hydroxyacyl-CoA dehydrogenase NAD-binding domain-containing protein [Mucilaginibacter sp. UR6-11]MCC8425841.1 3-hydroxyacyl-CoA dehydrogenase NAD-binding domain-containing protein [Mucilaginibacter sp. UR6-11]
MKKIAVIGSGTMGNGIAHTFAQHGFDVALADINNEALQRAISIITNNLDKQIKKGTITDQLKIVTLSRIKTYTDLKQAVKNAGLVVEAATEDHDIKLNLFKQLSEICGADVILASNTSSISITQIAAVTSNPGNVIGMHFMNPVPLMKLVEVIKGKETTDTVTATIMELAKQLDKIPVEVNDAPGFVANRILMPMINEAVYALYEQVSGVEEIDTVMKLGMSHPMGPLQLADFIGLDVCLAIMKVLYTGFNNEKYAPCPLLIDMVATKNLGVKTGSGFYKYTVGNKELIVADRFSK